MTVRFLAVCALMATMSGVANAQNVREPGGIPEDQVLALTTPDEFAWQLFFFMNRPAKPGTAGVADETARFGDTAGGRPMVWETWALASGDDQSEVYKPDGSKPVEWTQLDRSTRRLILSPNREKQAVTADSRIAAPPGASAFFPVSPDDQEVRSNRATFDFIRDNVLYNRDGLEDQLAKARSAGDRLLIQFKAGAKEIKAQWLEITSDQKTRYLSRDITANGVTKTYGLVSLHIITKDLPNWFWADFGHVDCEKKLNACNVSGQEPALTSPVDSTTRAVGGNPAPAGQNGVRNETKDTVWANYILRGTQTTFVMPDGRPTVLSNPVIENTFQRSSCISCHARAAVGERLLGLDGKPIADINRLSTGDATLGVPDPAIFGDSGLFRHNEIRFLQTDFLWSPVFRANRKAN
jgi:hypothetical protein